MKRAFAIRDARNMQATVVVATDAANALRQYAKDRNIGPVILPLRKEHPTRVFTHNSEADYIASQWSGQVGGIRFWITD